LRVNAASQASMMSRLRVTRRALAAAVKRCRRSAGKWTLVVDMLQHVSIRLAEVHPSLRYARAGAMLALARCSLWRAITLDDVLQRTACGDAAIATDGRLTVVLDTHMDSLRKKASRAS
jgi:hypothetical protein